MQKALQNDCKLDGNSRYGLGWFPYKNEGNAQAQGKLV